jgi:hypothetical protein
MPREYHGRTPSLTKLDWAAFSVDQTNRRANFPYDIAVSQDATPFNFLFPELQQPDMLLPATIEMGKGAPPRDVRRALMCLGATMGESANYSPSDSLIPSVYTYFGQFIDHDITLETRSDGLANLSDPNLQPLSIETIRAEIKNGRSPEMDLDNIYYRPAPRVNSKMLLGRVSNGGGRPPGKDDRNDLPRTPRNPNDPKTDRAAIIGDQRNDENLVIAQLHVAFLRAHNRIVDLGNTFDDAQRLLRQHYQWIILKDFLPRICDPWIVSDVLRHGNRFFLPARDSLFMPLEFSAAAYRFGHSMVRNQYRYNDNFRGATLADLFSLTALSGRLRDVDSLPESWIIQWENFADGGANRARPIDTALSQSLFDLTAFGGPMPIEARLPVRNLLRGYLLSLPTGQAVADALGITRMTPEEIEAVAAAVSQDQLWAVRAGGFSIRSPLWYYILAEAAAGGSNRLGAVGSTIVAEVLIGLIRGGKDSILRERNWQPTLATTTGRFDLRDLLELAGVLN